MARNIVVSSFSGSTPRRAEHLVPNGQSTRALDCKLEDGSLDSWREMRDVYTVPEGSKSVYQAFNCCWLTSTKCASWAEGSVEQRHVFATQYNDYDYPVRIVCDSLCEPTVYRLGLPCPTDSPQASAASNYSKGSASRQYVIRWVDTFGNTSNTSPASNTVIVADGDPVVLSGWALPASTENWDIQSIQVFRSVSGYESATKESENKIDAAWMLVAALPKTATSFVDRVSDADLLEALGEDEVEPPPANLRGITWIRTMNCLAGFAGKEIFFTENNSYHNWAYKLQLDDTAKAIVECNDMIYVATDGAPYAIEGNADCQTAGCRRAVRMPESLPLVGGGFRSMVATPSGAVYPTHSGLVYMTGRRAPVIVSANHYSPEDWQALHPDTMKAVYHEGRLYAFFRKGAFCLAMKDGATTAAETEHHTELSARPDEVMNTRLGRLFLRFGAEVKEWDRGLNKMPHRYESGETIANVPINFGALQVIMEPGVERVQLFVDDDVALDETLHLSDDFPLPLWATGQRFSWALSGTARVKLLSIAPSSKEL